MKITRICLKSLGRPGFGPNFSVEIGPGTPKNFRLPYCTCTAYFISIIFWNYRCIFLHLWLLICGALNRIHDFISSAIFLSSSSISFARSFSVTRSGTFSRYFSISIWARVVEAALLFSFGLVVFGPEYYASMVTESNGFSNCSWITWIIAISPRGQVNASWPNQQEV